ncbi:hypothetical protein JHK87_004007 [Glycine soja]|nr:hypothetical protein JHK87_004007 [Glycine soja]
MKIARFHSMLAITGEFPYQTICITSPSEWNRRKNFFSINSGTQNILAERDLCLVEVD